MNISSHLIVPLGQYLYQHYINSSRVLTSVARSFYGVTTVQDFANAGNMHKCVSFNNWVNVGTVTPLRLWDTAESSQAVTLSVSALPNGSVKTLNNDYVQYSIYNSNQSDNYQVRWLFWEEPLSQTEDVVLLNNLSLINENENLSDLSLEELLDYGDSDNTK